MAAEEGGGVVHAPHEVVSEAFVEQYYHLMGNATHEAHRLYVDASVITRPGPDGTMLSFTSLEAIKKHYLTCEYKGTTYDVLSVDSQRSLQDGILIVVIGLLTGNDNLKRKFSQTFYLALQGNVHVVVNDMYRFVDDESSAQTTVPAVVESVAVPETEVVKPVVEINKTKPVHKVDTPATKKSVNAAEVKKVVPALEKPKEPITETASAAAPPVDGGKKSYAAMVQSLSRNTAPFQVKAAPAQKPKSMEPTKARAAPASAAVVKSEKKSDQRIIDEPGTSIFVSNLPMDAKPPQLYELFKDFGPIKQGGVQIRSSRASGRCFGFVSFESVASVQSMLKAAKSNPFKLGDYKLRVKEKQVEFDGSKQSGGRSGGGSRAQNGSVDESKTPTGSVEESKTPTGSADGSKSENGSAAGVEDDGFQTFTSRRNRRGNGDKKNSGATKVKA
ncbi:unnamed protein product [Eruca vesicaria subsp. sativa]|uniref:Uncharacterized protein n=1 Tax=Eruca vesicaria subsp. sativa TaxID=29727 RepID=A0ABC8KXE4_ERUVS|nr:unnamed protein product [Eruca vesicaria subsp. sativa]